MSNHPRVTTPCPHCMNVAMLTAEAMTRVWREAIDLASTHAAPTPEPPEIELAAEPAENTSREAALITALSRWLFAQHCRPSTKVLVSCNNPLFANAIRLLAKLDPNVTIVEMDGEAHVRAVVHKPLDPERKAPNL